MTEKIFFQKLGKGQPVILIHGFCETLEIWNGVAEKLAEKFEVFSIDLPGFGKSQLPSTPFSIDEIGTKVLGWIDHKKIRNPVVIGHSLGGYVALAMAAKSPEKFAGLGLFHSSAFPDTEDRKANRNRVIEFVKAHGTDPFIDTFVPGLFFDKNHGAIPQAEKIARNTSIETLLAYTAAMRDRPSSIDFLQSYDCPVLVIGGEKDSIVPLETTLEFGQIAPKSTLHILKGIGHMAMYEQPDEAQAIVADFILANTIAR